jgi:dodecin
VLPHARGRQTGDGCEKFDDLMGGCKAPLPSVDPDAVEKAASSLRDLRIAEVAELDLQIEGGAVKAYRAKVKVSFKYED